VTECNRTSLAFSSLFRRKISADFDGGRLTSDAGGLLLREVDRRIGLTKALADCIVDPRDPDKIVHDVQTMLAQRIGGIALGYEDLNDHDTLRNDPVMQVAGGAFARAGRRRWLHRPHSAASRIGSRVNASRG
jgi:hypothetical protein